MSQQFLYKLKNYKDFSLDLQKRTLKIEGRINTNTDRKRSVEMIPDSPEQLERLNATGSEAFLPATVTIIITLTTFF